MNTSGKNTTIYRAAAIRDALGTQARPGILVTKAGRIIASGKLHDVEIPTRQQVIQYDNRLFIPQLVNTHGHLDLTSVGPLPYHGQFIDWLETMINARHTTNTSIADSVKRGITLSLQAGTGYVADIANTPNALTTRQNHNHLPGASYFECFGIGNGQTHAIEQLKYTVDKFIHEKHTESAPHNPKISRAPDIKLGIQPHAPYSAGLDLYNAAARLADQYNLPLSTHLAETPQEIEFVRHGTGPLAKLLVKLGKSDQTIKPTGRHPVEWLEPVLKRRRWLLAHCNYLDDHHLDILARCNASVAYCPVASDYFGHHQPQHGIYHRYREMLENGINVCLGTDSIVCQHPNDPQPLGIGSQMRYLYRRDRTHPETLLEMATTNGMRAMGLDPNLTSFRPGAPAKWAMVKINPNSSTDPLTQALENNHPIENVIAEPE